MPNNNSYLVSFSTRLPMVLSLLVSHRWVKQNHLCTGNPQRTQQGSLGIVSASLYLTNPQHTVFLEFVVIAQVHSVQWGVYQEQLQSTPSALVEGPGRMIILTSRSLGVGGKPREHRENIPAHTGYLQHSHKLHEDMFALRYFFPESHLHAICIKWCTLSACWRSSVSLSTWGGGQDLQYCKVSAYCWGHLNVRIILGKVVALNDLPRLQNGLNKGLWLSQWGPGS